MGRMVWLVTASVIFGAVFVGSSVAQSCAPQTALYKGGTQFKCFSQGYTRFPSNPWEADTTKIDLHDNLIVKIPPKSFEGLTALLYIGLFVNKIKEIPPGVFDGLTALQYLGLTSNDITAIPHRAFFGLTSLKQLFLFGNRITVIPETAFNDLTAIQEAPLYANPINCSVSLPSTSVECYSCSKATTVHTVNCDNVLFFQCSSECVYGSLTRPTTLSPTMSPTNVPTSSPTTTTTTPTSSPTASQPSRSPIAVPTTLSTVSPSSLTTTSPLAPAHDNTTSTSSSSHTRSPTLNPNDLHTTKPPTSSPNPSGAPTPAETTTAETATTTHTPAHTPTPSSSTCAHSGFPQHADVYTTTVCEILRNDDKCISADVSSNCNTTCCGTGPHSLIKDPVSIFPAWGIVLLAVVGVLVGVGGTYVVVRKRCSQRNSEYTLSHNQITLDTNTQSSTPNNQTHVRTPQSRDEQLELDEVANYNEGMGGGLLQ
eukprot:m.115055 g.115055  ORF g.115055 m.115055 type:complete len:483 (-) comp28394_c0_seq1:38-1486(-)